MMKFELARKYLVGFLALAVLTMSLTLPLSAPIAPVAAADLNAGPIVNADDTTITLVRTSSPLKPLTATDTVHTLTASILLGGSVIPDTSTYWVIFKVTLSASVVGSKTVIVPPGVGTATVSFVPSDLNPTPTITTTYQCTAFWVETNTTVADPNRAASGVADLVWQARAAATVAIDPPTATNTFPVITHTVTLVVKDQFNELFTFSGTITLGVSGSLTPTPASQGVPFTATHTATTTYTVTLPDGLCIAPSPGHWHDNLTATATFPVVGTKATATATKTWTYTPSYDELCLQPATQEKVAGQLATIKAVFCDQYNYWISKTGTVTWTASGPNHPTTAPVTGTGTYLALTYTGTQVGLDTITASAVFPDEVYFATDDQKTATVTWTADAGYHLVLQHVLAGTTTTATTVTNTVGYTHYLRATVTDTYGNVAPDGVTVTFAITAGPHTAIAIPSGVTAGGTGIVNTSYTALTPGDDTIQATANGSKSNEIIKSWHVGLPYTINLLPIDHITSVGDTHEVKAWVKDWCANLLNGVSVSFLVTNAHIRNGSATTDINGIASWTYTETTTGLDLIQASCPGSAGAPPATDLGADLLLGTIPSGTGTVYSNVSNNLWVWGTVTTIVLSPTSGINSLGATHKLIATVTNEFGKLMNGFPVLFTVTGSHPKTFTSNTDINGEATWSWIETTPGIDSIVASCGGINSNTAAKQWANRVITTITPTLGTTAYSATNNVSDGNTTHTITVWVRDQFGDAVTNTALNLVRTGANPKTAATGLTNGSGVLVYVYTNAYSGPASASGILGSDTNVFTGGTATATFTKVWTYTATYGSTTVPDKSTHYNYLNTTHTVTVNFYDQYSMSISATYSLYLYANSATVGTSKPFTGTGTFALLTYSSTTAGIDVLTISGTVANNAVGSRTQGIAAGTKCWANVPSVEPDNAVNALGATHEFVIKGVPGETVVVSFSSAGIFDLHNLSLTKIEPTGYAIEPTGSLPIPVANINHIHVLLDGTGSATIYVMSQAPGKFYMDTWFTELFSDLGRTSALPVIKRSKAYAELHWLDITPPDINPVTQVPTWDVH
ncbi:MAG: Ig-like domain-containing protein, partial [Coprothermobacterota bacterium]|nr:Ig-like domain-containing protein [Coprothermobacterota bacterium]